MNPLVQQASILGNRDIYNPTKKLLFILFCCCCSLCRKSGKNTICPTVEVTLGIGGRLLYAYATWPIKIVVWGSKPQEMAPWLNAHIHTTLAEDLHLIPDTHIRWVTLACNSGFKGFNSFFLSLRAPAFMCTYP